MAQLHFRYSTMNAGKSLELIKVAHNYEERGMEVLVLTPAKDNRYEEGFVTTRLGIQIPAEQVFEDTDLYELYLEKGGVCVLVDEAQFLNEQHVIQLSKIVDEQKIPVICYGLKNDFKNEMFPGTYYLMIYADKIEEIKTVCWCGKKATMTARLQDGKMVTSGVQLQIGGNESYVALCREHYMKRQPCSGK